MSDDSLRAYRDLSRDAWEDVVNWVGLLLGAANVLLGLLCLLQADSRWLAASFAYITKWADPTTWGMAFLLSGGLALLGMIIGNRYVLASGHALSAFWCLLWLVAFVLGALVSGAASLLHIAPYASLALLHGLMAAVTFPRGSAHVS